MPTLHLFCTCLKELNVIGEKPTAMMHLHHSTETALVRVTTGAHVAQSGAPISDLILLILSVFLFTCLVSSPLFEHPSFGFQETFLPQNSCILTGHTSAQFPLLDSVPLPGF